MKPKNKFQQHILELSKSLPKITEPQQRWAYSHCFEHIARKTVKGIISCLECGTEWTDKTLTAKKTICPHCGTNLTVKQTRAYKFKQIEYFCIISKCEDFQVLRFFYIESCTRKAESAYYYCREVVQRWIAPNGKYATLAMLRPMFCFTDSWQWHSDLEIRNNKELYDIMPTAVYPRQKIIPELKLRGFKGAFHRLTPFELFRSLLTENKAETLLKTGQTALLRHFVRSQIRNVDFYWASIRIAIRNGYIIKDGSMWCDYIDLLNYFDRDVRSPKYVCPDSLKTAHDHYVEKQNRQREQEQLKEQQRRAIETEERFRELKAKFFGIIFSDGELQVRVLDSVKEFWEEGKAMHHCVFSNKYHLRPDSLILSATIDGKRIETVEVSLQTLKVVQSRGVCNQDTEYHDRIINLVNKNRNLIRKRIAA